MPTQREAVQMFQRQLGAIVLTPVRPKPKTNRRAPQTRGLSHFPNRSSMSTPEQPQTDFPGNDGDEWGEGDQPVRPAQPFVIQSPPENPHNHVYTWSPKLADGSMLVIRSNTAEGLLTATRAVTDITGQLLALWDAAKASVQGFQSAMREQITQAGLNAPPPAFPQPPNQGYQGQPPWQTAGAPQGAFPQAPQGGNGGGNRGPKPRPTDWPQVFKLNVPITSKDTFKAFREQHKETLKGKVYWAGGGDYWIHPEVAQGFVQFGQPVPA